MASGRIFTQPKHLIAVLMLGTALAGAPGLAQQGGISAFQQALAASAADSDVVSGWYRAHNYVTLWTGPQDAQRRSVLLAALDLSLIHISEPTRH